MRFESLKHDKGVAGTAVLLSLIVALFVIGLLVMIFALMGGALKEASYTETTQTVLNEDGWINSTGYTLEGASANGARNFAITKAVNGSVVVESGNWTISSVGVVTNATAMIWTSVVFNYTYIYDANNSATEVIGDTTTSISSVTTFFTLFIVIGSMVVLILLTVIIIVAIKQSGMLGDGTAA
jgi:hypothetical protein